MIYKRILSIILLLNEDLNRNYQQLSDYWKEETKNSQMIMDENIDLHQRIDKYQQVIKDCHDEIQSIYDYYNDYIEVYR